jgi:hypothetical protein
MPPDPLPGSPPGPLPGALGEAPPDNVSSLVLLRLLWRSENLEMSDEGEEGPSDPPPGPLPGALGEAPPDNVSSLVLLRLL